MNYKKLITKLQNGEVRIEIDVKDWIKVDMLIADAFNNKLGYETDLSFISKYGDSFMLSGLPISIPIIKLSTIKTKEPKWNRIDAVNAVREGSHSITWDKGDKSEIIAFLKEAFSSYSDEDAKYVTKLNPLFAKYLDGWQAASAFNKPTIKLSEIKRKKKMSDKMRKICREIYDEKFAERKAKSEATVSSITPESALSFDMPKAEEPKSELEVEKWYKHYCGSLACWQGKNKSSYGFSVFIKDWYCAGWIINDGFERWKPAATEEVTTALTNEAIKRGLVEGVWIMWNGYTNKIKGSQYLLQHDGTFVMYELGIGTILMQNGVWATLEKSCDCCGNLIKE